MSVPISDLLRDPALRLAVVTAHPDDESLWCGGLLLRYPGNWTVICCSTPKRDPIRAYKFFDACERLGARGRIVVQPEDLNTKLSFAWIDLSPYDLIVTHGEAGEYGHPHHN